MQFVGSKNKSENILQNKYTETLWMNSSLVRFVFTEFFGFKIYIFTGVPLTPDGGDFEIGNTEIKMKTVGKRLVRNILSNNKQQPIKPIKSFSYYLDPLVTLTSIALGCEIFYVKQANLTGSYDDIRLQKIISSPIWAC